MMPYDVYVTTTSAWGTAEQAQTGRASQSRLILITPANPALIRNWNTYSSLIGIICRLSSSDSWTPVEVQNRNDCKKVNVIAVWCRTFDGHVQSWWVQVASVSLRKMFVRVNRPLFLFTGLLMSVRFVTGPAEFSCISQSCKSSKSQTKNNNQENYR